VAHLAEGLSFVTLLTLKVERTLISFVGVIIIVIVITKPNSVALVRKRTIPTERPPLVGEVSEKFS
jgi:hypothetical protein